MSIPNYWFEYWENFAEAFIHPMTANGILGNFVSNPNVTGAYAEAWIRSMVSSMLPRFRISTGAIIKPSDREIDKKSVPQCDLIIWDPSELPALFEEGEFALVPNVSVRAIIEIKRSVSNIEHFKKQLKLRQNILAPQYYTKVLGVVVSHNSPLFPQNESVTPTWLQDAHLLWSSEPAKIRLLDASTNQPDTNEIFAFIYFLAQVARQELYDK